MVHASMQTAELEIAGMASASAKRGVLSALNCIRGVVQVAPRSNTSCVAVTYDANRVCPRQFRTAVFAMGCEVRNMTPAAELVPPCSEVGAKPSRFDKDVQP